MVSRLAGVCAFCLTVILGCATPAGAEDSSEAFATYDSPYYTIYSDLDKQRLTEAQARLTPLAEFYLREVQTYSNKRYPHKLPIYLFSREQDYRRVKHNVPRHAQGNFDGQALYCAVPEGERAGLGWEQLQREGFRQFAHIFMTGNLPPWLNEGIAEYYKHAIWTGDGYVAGGIPPARVKSVRKHIKDKSLVPLVEFTAMAQAKWIAATAAERDLWCSQAWSMVYFLSHAEGGKYQRVLVGYVKDIQSGKNPRAAFTAHFGKDGGPLGKAYEQFWTNLPAEPSPEVYAKATTAVLTSFLARATASGQKFKDYAEFINQAKEDKLLNATGQWLPKELLSRAVAEAGAMDAWSLQSTAGKAGKLLLKLPNGTTYTGSFLTSGKKVTKVEVTVAKAKVVSAPPKSAPPKTGGLTPDEAVKKVNDRLKGFRPPPGGQ